MVAGYKLTSISEDIWGTPPCRLLPWYSDSDNEKKKKLGHRSQVQMAGLGENLNQEALIPGRKDTHTNIVHLSIHNDILKNLLRSYIVIHYHQASYEQCHFIWHGIPSSCNPQYIEASIASPVIINQHHRPTIVHSLL